MRMHEQPDLPVGARIAANGQKREQKCVVQCVSLTLQAAKIFDVA
jgi:hypothetical protein